MEGVCKASTYIQPYSIYNHLTLRENEAPIDFRNKQ